MNKVLIKNTALNIKQQSGAALLIGMVMLATVMAFYIMGNMGTVPQYQERQQDRVESMAEAKKALIAYAVNYIDNNEGQFGVLPCPATGGNITEGVQDLSCGAENISALGRLPWRTLDLPPLFDANNECLWYAVSGYYKNNVPSKLLNADTNGQFEIYSASDDLVFGAKPEDRIVAVIIAPNRPLVGQARIDDPLVTTSTARCKGNYTASNYLEGNGTRDNSVMTGIADEIDTFINAGTNSETAANPHNDLILTITREEIWRAVKRRNDFKDVFVNLTQAVANCILEYGQAGTVNNLPWPAPLDLSGTSYRDDANYADTATPVRLFGRVPDGVANSETQLDANPSSGGTLPGGTGIEPAPTGGAQCTDCWDKYLSDTSKKLVDYYNDIDDANTDYQACIDKGKKTVAQCDSDLADDLQKAENNFAKDAAKILSNYNNCLSKNSCTAGTSGGGGSAATCDDCQAVYDAEYADAKAVYDAEMSAIQSDIDACVAKGGTTEGCTGKQNKNIKKANDKFNKAVAEAKGTLNICLLSNECNSGGGSKGISNLMASCTSISTEEFTLWQQWKDHFYYVVSGSYAPDSTEVNCTAASAECVATNANKHAAIILYSGEKLASAIRNDPDAGDTDTKNDLTNYLEGMNTGDYPNPVDPMGNRTYDPVQVEGLQNDYLYCINDTDPLSMGDCP